MSNPFNFPGDGGGPLVLSNRGPQQAAKARSRILMVAVSVHRRFVSTIFRWPRRLYSLADPRCVSAHKELVVEFFRIPPCCHPPGMARDIRERMDADTFVQDLTVLNAKTQTHMYKIDSHNSPAFHMWLANIVHKIKSLSINNLTLFWTRGQRRRFVSTAGLGAQTE